ncbi:MAG TPA: carboxypeptidase-like regulatory domain-containing protein [Mycobacteriales bacterium]|nr:carboxypeptidase-like regulatory domain-containing protein [Mycobacteriales bacterium]
MSSSASAGATITITTATNADSSSTDATPTSSSDTTSSSPAAGGTGVEGLVTAAPTCPVQRPGQSCPPAPVAGTVQAVDATGQLVASAATDGNGAYSLHVPGGSYTLHVNHDGQYPRCPDVPVTVSDGSMTKADIDCDTGIR